MYINFKGSIICIFYAKFYLLNFNEKNQIFILNNNKIMNITEEKKNNCS